jgi:Na+/glutamate symporter
MPKSPQPDNRDKHRQEILRYAGLSTEVVASMGVSLFIGIKADKWLRVSFPVFAWALPLLVIVVLIVKLIKESSKRRDGK